MLPLPIQFDYPLPNAKTFFPSVFMAGGLGYIYGKVTDVPAFQCAKIFAITQWVNSALYLLGNQILFESGKCRKDGRRAFFIVTTIFTQAIGILAMKHFNIIGAWGAIGWSILSIGLGYRQNMLLWDYYFYEDETRCIDLKNILYVKKR